MDLVAQRYGQRPSELVGIADPQVALDFDAAVAIRAFKEAERASQPGLDPDRFDEWGNCLDFSPIIQSESGFSRF